MSKKINKNTIGLVLLLVAMVLLSGCGSLGGTERNVTQTTVLKPSTESITPTTTPTPTATPTETTTQAKRTATTPTATPTDPQNWSQKRKYEYGASEFKEVVSAYVESPNVSIQNDTLEFTYVMREPSNYTKTRNESGYILNTYSSMADHYMSDETGVDRTWVPKRLEVTALHPENKEIYWQGHTNFTIMNEYRTNERSYLGYLVQYHNSLEWGPAHPEYEGD